MIIGHEKKWNYLKKSAENASIAHAYLFYGPSSVGKRKTAIEFGKYINCTNRTFDESCQKCQVCYQIEKKIYPDLFFIEPEEKKSLISINQVKNLKARFSLSSVSDNYKIAIIDKAHLMTQDAQNALLKQLEEPRGKTVIILITEYPNSLLNTVVSRCQKIRFSTVSPKTILKILPGFKDSLLLEIGRPGIILNSISSDLFIKSRDEQIEAIKKLKQKSFYERFSYAKEVIKNKEELDVIETWLVFFRQFLKKIIRKETKLFWNSQETKKILNNLQEIQHLFVTSNINRQLALELFLMEI